MSTYSTSRSNLDVRVVNKRPRTLPCPPDCGETGDYLYREPASVQMGYPIAQKALKQTVYSADGLGTKEEYQQEQSKSSGKKTNWLLIAAVAVIGYVVYKYA